jgi:hypothetical protein
MPVPVQNARKIARLDSSLDAQNDTIRRACTPLDSQI